MGSIKNTIDTFKSDKFWNYPSEFAPQKEKLKKEYGLQYVKAILSQYLRGGSYMFYNARDRYREYQRIISGEEDLSFYKRLIDPKSLGADCNESFININWELPKFANKFMQVIIGKLDKIGWELQVEAIDETAINAKKDYERRLKALVELQGLLDSLGLMVNPEDDIAQSLFYKDLPKNTEELELEVKLNYRLQGEIEMEQAIQLTDVANEIEQVLQEVDKDLAYFYCAGIKCKLDSNGFPKITRVNPMNLIVSNTSNERFSDLQHVAEIRVITLADLRQEAGSQFTEEEYKIIADIAMSSNMNNDVNNTSSFGYYHGEGDGLYAFDHCRVEIVDFWFYSSDKMNYEIKNKSTQNDDNDKSFVKASKETKKNKSIFKKDYDYSPKKDYYENHPDRELVRVNYKNVYKGSYISGTDFLYNYSLMYDMQRVKENLTDTRLPFILYSPTMTNGKVLPMVEQMLPILQDLNENWLRYKHILSQVVPPGIAIDFDALEEVSLSLGGKDMTKADILDLYYQKGILIMRRGEYQGMPIQELNQTIPNQMFQYFQNIQNNLNMLREITGITYAVDASTPPDRAGKAVTELMGVASDNVLTHLYNAKKYIREKQVEVTLDLILESAKKGAFHNKVRKAIGSANERFFKFNSDSLIHTYGVLFTPAPTEQQWFQFRNLVRESLAAGKITLADALFVEQVQHFKLAQQLLALKEEAQRRKMIEESQMQQQQNQELQMQSAQQAQQAQQAERQIEMESKLTLLQKEYELKAMYKEKETELQMALLEKQAELKKIELELTKDRYIDVEAIKSEKDIEIANIRAKSTSNNDNFSRFRE